MNFFKKKSDYKSQLEQLEQAKLELSTKLDNNMLIVEEEINSTRQFFEKMKNHGIRRFDNLLNLCLYSSITSADLLLLTEKIRICKRRLEKLLFARMLAMIVIEYLKDINELLGHKLIGELNSNNHKEFVSTIKNLNSQYADIRKKNEKVLTTIRNNTTAHKTKDALNLVHYIFNLDPEEIYNLALEVIKTNTLLTDETTKIYYKMLDEAKTNEKNSR